MRLKAFPSFVECSHHAFQAFAPSVPSSLFPSSSSCPKMDRPVSLVVLSNPFVSRTLVKSQSFDKISRGHTVRRSCSSNLDDTYHDEPSLLHVEGVDTCDEAEGHRKEKNVHCAISKKQDQDSSFLCSRFDFLEPMMLGIRPEFPDWPDRETIMWANIERKAKSLDIPLSLRMIKKKLQWEEGFTDAKELAYCPVKTAFASMVFIIVELQSHALHMRESLCNEDLEIITSKVQKEMHSSFVWLFQQVFSRTPTLMLLVMTLLADFSVNSIVDTSLLTSIIESKTDMLPAELKRIQTQIGTLPESSQDLSVYTGDELESVTEMNLWNSMVDDATKMREGVGDVEVLDRDTMRYFVSPVSVELEADVHEDYLRTDLLYQMNLSQEPNNPLLLCNYAQFLSLVARDHDRAEECFKRAIQILPPDAESLNRYGNFLWTVRKDMWGAEEMFLQALALEPDNSFYASRYANFLWSSGGEDTCFPLNTPHNPMNL